MRLRLRRQSLFVPGGRAANGCTETVQTMARQVGPTHRNPVVIAGHQGRQSDEGGVCGFHRGPGSNKRSHYEAGYMAATTLVFLRFTPPMQTGGGPYMITARSEATRVLDYEPRWSVWVNGRRFFRMDSPFRLSW